MRHEGDTIEDTNDLLERIAVALEKLAEQLEKSRTGNRL